MGLSVFLVESPTQLVSAIEAKSNNSEENVLVVLYGTSDRVENNLQLDKLVNSTNWMKVYRFYQSSNLYFNIFLNTFYLMLLKCVFVSKVSKVYLGEYRNYFLCCIAKLISTNKEVLLEDGTITINLQKKHFTNGRGIRSFYRDKRAYKLMYLYSKLFFFEIDDVAPDLYSFFDLEQYLSEGQVNLRKNSKIEVSKQLELFYFFGSKYSEAGLFSLETELALLSFSFEYVRCNFNCRIIYVPHRDDSKAKLKYILTLGIEIKNIDGPCEPYFELNDYIPSYIGGFFTTCLYSLTRKFYIKKAVSFDVSRYIISSVDFDDAKRIYEYYSESNIHVIEATEKVNSLLDSKCDTQENV